MAELLREDGTYRNVPVYDNFEYLDYRYGSVTLSPIWTASGLLVPIAHSDTQAYMRISREECIKMANDILHLDMIREICESLNKRTNTAIDRNQNGD